MTTHAIFDRPLDAPVPQGMDQAIFGMGCLWGAERLFWRQTGVWLTEAGFVGGPGNTLTDDQIRSGSTGPVQAVRVVFDSSKISYDHLLQIFWENHDPTKSAGDAPGHRSMILTFNNSQQSTAEAARIDYDNRLAVAGFGPITTEIRPAGPFHSALPAHQQYLHRNPGTDCGPKGTGIEASLPNPDPI